MAQGTPCKAPNQPLQIYNRKATLLVTVSARPADNVFDFDPLKL